MIALVGWLLRFLGGLAMLLGLAIIVLHLVAGGVHLGRTGGAGGALAGVGLGFLAGLYGSVSALVVGAVLFLLGRALKPQEQRRRSRVRLVHVRDRR